MKFNIEVDFNDCCPEEELKQEIVAKASRLLEDDIRRTIGYELYDTREREKLKTSTINAIADVVLNKYAEKIYDKCMEIISSKMDDLIAEVILKKVQEKAKSTIRGELDPAIQSLVQKTFNDKLNEKVKEQVKVILRGV